MRPRGLSRHPRVLNKYPGGLITIKNGLNMRLRGQGCLFIPPGYLPWMHVQASETHVQAIRIAFGPHGYMFRPL